jgi:hypothetical protein
MRIYPEKKKLTAIKKKEISEKTIKITRAIALIVAFVSVFFFFFKLLFF